MKRFFMTTPKGSARLPAQPIGNKSIAEAGSSHTKPNVKSTEADKPTVTDYDSSGSSIDSPEKSTSDLYERECPIKRRRLAVIREDSPLTDDANETENTKGEDRVDDSVEENRQAGKTKKSSKQKFNGDWKTSFSWLDLNADKPYCTVCLKVIHGGFTHLRRHDATNAHQENIKKAEKTPEIKRYFDAGQHKTQNLIKAGEMKMTMFLHEHNLAFSLMDYLPKLVTSVCPDSKIAISVKCGRTKATSLTKDCVAEEQMEQILAELKQNVFSVINDETTDISTEKSLAIVVRLYDYSQWKDRFFGLIKVKSCSAEGLFGTIVDYFEKRDIPMTNMIGLAADNASVMLGKICHSFICVGLQQRKSCLEPQKI